MIGANTVLAFVIGKSGSNQHQPSSLNAADSYMVNTTGTTKVGVGVVQRVLNYDPDTGVSLVKVGSSKNDDGYAQYAWMTGITPTNGTSVSLVRVHMRTPIPFDDIMNPSSSLIAIPSGYDCHPIQHEAGF
jgi:hypothetical protein